MARPPLSVVFATGHPWPDVRPYLEPILEQTRTVGGEVVVVDGNGHAVPDVLDGVVRVDARGGDIFAMRAMGALRATGDVLAYTEDHCQVAPDWCEQLLTAHRERPDASAVAGAVVNGSDTRAMDRANFALVHCSNLPPLRTVPDDWVPSSANVSYKRQQIPPQVAHPGWLEYVYTPDLIRSGRLVVDDRVRVSHVQSHGFVGTIANHYHAARSMSGLAATLAPPLGRRAWARVAVTYPYRTVRRTLRVSSEKPGGARPVYRLLAPIIVLAISAAVGVLAGAVAGIGHSARRLK
jgi:hypothetical protein